MNYLDATVVKSTVNINPFLPNIKLAITNNKKGDFITIRKLNTVVGRVDQSVLTQI